MDVRVTTQLAHICRSDKDHKRGASESWRTCSKFRFSASGLGIWDLGFTWRRHLLPHPRSSPGSQAVSARCFPLKQVKWPRLTDQVHITGGKAPRYVLQELPSPSPLLAVTLRPPSFFLHMRSFSSPRSILLLEGLAEILRSSSKLPSQRGLARAGWTTPVTSSHPSSHTSSHSSVTIALKDHFSLLHFSCDLF